MRTFTCRGICACSTSDTAENPREFDDEIRRALGTTAADLMTPDVLTVESSTDLADLATLMVDKRVNSVP